MGQATFPAQSLGVQFNRMIQATRKIPLKASPGEPVYELAELLPEQGSWTEKAYLSLQTNRLVEFDNGMIEVLALPKKAHQKLVLFLCDNFRAFLASRGLGGLVLVAGYKIRIPSGKYREPDVLYLSPEQDAQSNEDFTTRAEWVCEVVSPDDPDRDYMKKRADYALAGIGEFWIIDCELKQILVLTLLGNVYVEHGKYLSGQNAESVRFPGLIVAVDEMIRMGRPS